MSYYTEIRDSILTHAIAAAASVSAEFTDVQVGPPIPKGNRCVRLFWAGEAEPERMGAQRTLNSELLAETLALVGFWSMPTLDETPMKAMDTEMVAFKHQLRTRVLGDSQLGGDSYDLVMRYVQPDFMVLNGTRWAVVEIEFSIEYVEYAIGA